MFAEGIEFAGLMTTVVGRPEAASCFPIFKGAWVSFQAYSVLAVGKGYAL